MDVIKFDVFVKSRNIHNFVIPVKTGIQSFQVLGRLWIPACAGMTDFLRMCQLQISSEIPHLFSETILHLLIIGIPFGIVVEIGDNG